MTTQTSWRLYWLELFGDSLFGMLILGFFARSLRPASWIGTIGWGAVVIVVGLVSEMGSRRFLDGAFATRLKARTAHEGPVSAARLTYLVGGVFLYVMAGAALLGVFWLLQPMIRSFATVP